MPPYRTASRRAKAQAGHDLVGVGLQRMLRVTLSELSRLPVERLAKLLMEWAIEDQRLLVRLHATLEESQPPPQTGTRRRPARRRTSSVRVPPCGRRRK